MISSTPLLLVNFGGPRHLGEITEFLQELLTDQDVVRTRLPRLLHNWLFSRIARKRSIKIAHDYQLIGGKSPIYADTEAIASFLQERLKRKVITFHRYLPQTHPGFLKQILSEVPQDWDVFPLFPQFTHATTGSIARWLQRHLPKRVTHRLRWVKSYPTHPQFITAYQRCIRDFLHMHQLDARQVFLIFSAHGIPKSFLKSQDPYQAECEQSVEAVMKGFPQMESLLSYQSKFGPGEWLRPYTSEVVEQIQNFAKRRTHVVIVPISFTSDHIETLFEIQEQYLPPIRRAGLLAYRCPSLNLRPDWLESIVDILQTSERVSNKTLIR